MKSFLDFKLLDDLCLYSFFLFIHHIAQQYIFSLFSESFSKFRIDEKLAKVTQNIDVLFEIIGKTCPCDVFGLCVKDFLKNHSWMNPSLRGGRPHNEAIFFRIWQEIASSRQCNNNDRFHPFHLTGYQIISYRSSFIEARVFISFLKNFIRIS